jgi:hypothetical protein
LGRVSKGAKCTVTGCEKDAIRSLPAEKVTGAGLKVGEARRAYLCKEHYKEYKKGTKKERMLEKWRHGTRTRARAFIASSKQLEG